MPRLLWKSREAYMDIYEKLSAPQVCSEVNKNDM